MSTTYILLFRGVGGATQLPTAPLRAALTKAGFANVATYINSGNAVVTSDWDRDKVIATVADICRRKFKFDKAIFAPTLAEWRKLVANNPFGQVPVPKFLHAALLADKPKPAAVKAVAALAKPGERFAVVGKVAYLHTPGGFGTSDMGARFDKTIGVTNTARNWNTVTRLLELASRPAEAT